MNLHDESLFVFYFDSEEVIIVVLERGSFYTSRKLFVIKPWNKDLEKDLEYG